MHFIGLVDHTNDVIVQPGMYARINTAAGNVLDTFQFVCISQTCTCIIGEMYKSDISLVRQYCIEGTICEITVLQKYLHKFLFIVNLTKLVLQQQHHISLTVNV